jgi:antitoxin (DNA-binding transcriptional repressor) of toxin-antitoxin stability system
VGIVQADVGIVQTDGENVTRRRAVVILTTSGHTVTMERVSVAELKSRLSHYLREVRAGNSFTVVSRDIPVATLGPLDPDEIDDLIVIEPTDDASPWTHLDLPPLKHKIDAVALLRDDRDNRDQRLLEIALEAIEARRRPEREEQS